MEHNYYAQPKMEAPLNKDLFPVGNSDVEKLKKWTLYGLVGLVAATAGITILIKIFKMVF